MCHGTTACPYIGAVYIHLLTIGMTGACHEDFPGADTREA